MKAFETLNAAKVSRNVCRGLSMPLRFVVSVRLMLLGKGINAKSNAITLVRSWGLVGGAKHNQ